MVIFNAAIGHFYFLQSKENVWCVDWVSRKPTRLQLRRRHGRNSRNRTRLYLHQQSSQETRSEHTFHVTEPSVPFPKKQGNEI